jgi:hypothetical protein
LPMCKTSVSLPTGGEKVPVARAGFSPRVKALRDRFPHEVLGILSGKAAEKEEGPKEFP